MNDAETPDPAANGATHDLSELLRQNLTLRAAEESLRRENETLQHRVVELENVNREGQSARRATLNVLEDAMASRALAEMLNQKLVAENADRRQAEQALQENQRELEVALRNAQQAHQAKDQFIASLSHELRTPLTPILISAGLNADDPKLPKRVRDEFDSIRSNVQLEARLIDDLLDQTQIARGKTRLEMQLVNAHEILQDALLTVADDFMRKDIEPEVEAGARVTCVHGDPVRLQQILWNVLRNAAKFTDTGGRVRVRTANPEKNVFTVAITDSGIGLTSEEIARMFQPFAQGDHAASDAPRHFGGLGLGLAISRELVALHGGSITVASEGRGRGACFTVSLPVAADLAAPASRKKRGSRRPDSSAPVSSASRHVLLVEDHSPTRAALRLVLSRRGYVVTEAGSVGEALQRETDQAFDLLVSDLGLPDGSGYDVVKQIRARQPEVPAIALSGFGMETDKKQAFAAGFAAHLTKPVGVEELDALLDLVERGEPVPLAK